MTTTVLFHDAADIACVVLDAALDVDVVRKVPATRPTSFVRVRRTGGPRRSRVADAAQISVESYATTVTAAGLLAEQARRALHAARGTVVEGSTIYAVDEVSGPAELPDPLTDQPRYTQTFTFPVRGT